MSAHLSSEKPFINRHARVSLTTRGRPSASAKAAPFVTITT
jgi:hypothetical protein